MTKKPKHHHPLQLLSIMKRSIQDGTEVMPLRKKTPSLFSIATVLEDEEGSKAKLISRCNSASSSTVGLDIMERDEGHTSCPLTAAAAAPPLAPTEDEISSSEEDVLSFSNNSRAKPIIAAPVQLAPEDIVLDEVICDSCEKYNTINTEGDFRSGLVFEAGSNHFDRHNRLHKERPIRVICIMEALKKSDNNIFDRCCVLGESSDSDDGLPSRSAADFLDDDDYLRVHLPGYMQR